MTLRQSIFFLKQGWLAPMVKGYRGASWIKNREVGEVVGEFFFGAENNPFRGNDILLPKNWDDTSMGVGDPTAASDE
jgi:hypothetical protein